MKALVWVLSLGFLLSFQVFAASGEGDKLRFEPHAQSACMYSTLDLVRSKKRQSLASVEDLARIKGKNPELHGFLEKSLSTSAVLFKSYRLKYDPGAQAFEHTLEIIFDEKGDWKGAIVNSDDINADEDQVRFYFGKNSRKEIKAPQLYLALNYEDQSPKAFWLCMGTKEIEYNEISLVSTPVSRQSECVAETLRLAEARVFASLPLYPTQADLKKFKTLLYIDDDVEYEKKAHAEVSAIYLSYLKEKIPSENRLNIGISALLGDDRVTGDPTMIGALYEVTRGEAPGKDRQEYFMGRRNDESPFLALFVNYSNESPELFWICQLSSPAKPQKDQD